MKNLSDTDARTASALVGPEFDSATTDALPPEILAGIFNRIDAIEQLRLKRVCRRWCAILSSFPVEIGVRLAIPESVLRQLPTTNLLVDLTVSARTRSITIYSACCEEPAGQHPTKLIHPAALARMSSICQNLQCLTLYGGFVELCISDALPLTIRKITLKNVEVTRVTALRPMVYEFAIAVPFVAVILSGDNGLSVKEQVLDKLEQFLQRLSHPEIAEMTERILQIECPFARNRIRHIIKTRERMALSPDVDMFALRTLTLWDLSVYLSSKNVKSLA